MATDRYGDLLLQGFMKIGRTKKHTAAPLPVVSCFACKNWHTRGQHTEKDATKRQANMSEYRAQGFVMTRSGEPA